MFGIVFTGLVEVIGEVVSARKIRGGVRLALDLGHIANDFKGGESVAVAGACLTVASVEGHIIGFDLSQETIQKTRLGSVQPSEKLNVELSLRAGSPLGGHFVSGHVDGLGKFLRRETQGDYEVQVFQAPNNVAPLLIPKGSVSIEGVSLTVAEIFSSEEFSVALIPETLERTTLSALKNGDSVHMEGDLLGKFVFAYLDRRQTSAGSTA